MKAPGLFIFLLLSSAAAGQRSSAVHQLEYTVDISDPASGVATVMLSYSGPSVDSVAFHLPSNWGEESKLTYFRLTAGAHSCRIHSDSTTLTCRRTKKQPLVLQYQVLNAINDSITGDGEVYLPQLKPNYFTAYSNGFLLSVDDDSVCTKTNATLHFRLPESWKAVHSNFGSGTTIKTGVVANQEVQNAIFHAGDYRVYHLTTQTKQQLTFCIRGKWSFQDTALLHEAELTLDQQRRFWNDYTTKKFFISMTPGTYPNEQSMSYTGTGLHDAFVMSAYCNSQTTPENLRYLLNHELMHHWIGGVIENAKDEELSYWFSEGFTDYFARINMKESGMISERAYNQLIDSVLKIHYSSDCRAYANDSIKAHFWDNREIEKLPYNRGSLFAFYLDNLLQRQTNGDVDLKRVMQEMLAELKRGNSYIHRPFDKSWFNRKIQELSGLAVDSLLTRYVILGTPVTLEEFNQVLQQKLVMKNVRVFDMGFETQKINGEKGGVITSVTSKSGAEEAGFLPGDHVLGYNLMRNPNTEGELLIRRNGEETWMKFYPYSVVCVPQLEKE